jgi:precorrin-6A/cobalt-precorrin-6A reductase
MAASDITTPTVSGAGPTQVPRSGRRRVLILGGTAEARALAGLLSKAGFDPVTSLAGVTDSPGERPGQMRSGGFGGAEGLCRYMAAERFSALVDATHPFATVISNYAKEAAEHSGLPLLRLERPAWAPELGDRWAEVVNNSAAVSAIPSAARVLLTIGRKEILPYFARPDISGIARMIEPVDMEVAGNWRILLARPPFSLDEELSLLSDHSISHLVTKNSGGEEMRAKLVAARVRGIDVIMIRRPDKPKVPTVANPQAVLAFLDQAVSA